MTAFAGFINNTAPLVSGNPATNAAINVLTSVKQFASLEPADALLPAPAVILAGLTLATAVMAGSQNCPSRNCARPLASSSRSTTAADGVDSTTGDLKIGHEYVPLASTTPETDLEVGYVTTFMDGAGDP